MQISNAVQKLPGPDDLCHAYSSIMRDNLFLESRTSTRECVPYLMTGSSTKQGKYILH